MGQFGWDTFWRAGTKMLKKMLKKERKKKIDNNNNDDDKNTTRGRGKGNCITTLKGTQIVHIDGGFFVSFFLFFFSFKLWGINLSEEKPMHVTQKKKTKKKH